MATYINHLNIVVADMERSLAFYVGLLGMRMTFETDLTGDWIDTVTGLAGVSARCVFCQPSGGGCRLELLEYRLPPGADPADNRLANTRGLRHLAIEVDDLDAAYERLTGSGRGSDFAARLRPLSHRGRHPETALLPARPGRRDCGTVRTPLCAPCLINACTQRADYGKIRKRRVSDGYRYCQ